MERQQIDREINPINLSNVRGESIKETEGKAFIAVLEWSLLMTDTKNDTILTDIKNEETYIDTMYIKRLMIIRFSKV